MPWRGRDAFYVVLIWLVLTFFFGTRVGEAALEPGFLVFAYVLLLFVTLLWTRRYRSSGLLFGRRFGLRPAALFTGIGIGLAALIVQVLLILVVVAVSGHDLGDERDLLPLGDSPTLLVVMVVVAAPFVEEIFFRGLLQQGLGRSFRSSIAIGVSAVLFGLAHIQGGPIDIVISVGNGTLVGVLFGWIFLRSENLAIPIAAHATLNAVALLVALSAV